jgi:hypothetical protein
VTAPTRLANIGQVSRTQRWQRRLNCVRLTVAEEYFVLRPRYEHAVEDRADRRIRGNTRSSEEVPAYASRNERTNRNLIGK